MAERKTYRILLMTAMMMLSSLAVMAQGYRSWHDELVYDKFKEIEVELKTEQRILYNAYLARESDYAATVDSLFTSRLKNLLQETGDRVFDAQWLTERSKIESQLNEMQKNVGLIRTYGGSDEDYSYWKRIYNMIAQNAIPMVHESYQPGYKRMEEYQAIYDDLKQYNSRLRDCLKYWEGVRFLESLRQMQGHVHMSRLDSIAGICLGRWRLKAQAAHESSPKPKKLRNVWKDE